MNGVDEVSRARQKLADLDNPNIPGPGAIGTDEHRIETARWVLETFNSESAIFKKATKLLEHYLAGKPLPKVEP